MRNYAKSWLDLEAASGGRSTMHGTAADFRAQFTGLATALTPLYPALSTAVKVENVVIDTDVKGILYTPAGNASDKPIIVYYHPGGLVIDASIFDDYLCSTVAEKTNSVVLSVLYRLSPEVKVPVHLRDAVKGLEWAYENAAKYGASQSKLFSMGASAGAGLAIAAPRQVLLGKSTLPKDAVKGIASLSPCTVHPDNIPAWLAGTHTSFEDNKVDVPVIDLLSMQQFYGISGTAPDDSDYLVALDEDAFKVYPPTYVVTTEFDPLRDDGKAIVKGLEKAGRPVKTDHYDTLPHCFWLFPNLPETEEFYGKLFAAVEWLVARA